MDPLHATPTTPPTAAAERCQALPAATEHGEHGGTRDAHTQDARKSGRPSVEQAGELSGDRRAAAWVRLQEGNRRWANGRSTAEITRSPQRRVDLVSGQAPFAMILSCSDSRVPTEILFDQGLGDLFVVRTAGHAVDDTVLGSLEYAVSVLGVDLVLVLGHEGCGAVAAAAQTITSGAVPGGYIRDIVERLSCHVTQARHAGLLDNDDVARWHCAATLDLLQQRSEVLREAVFHARVGVLAATYGLSSGLAIPTAIRKAADAPSDTCVPKYATLNADRDFLATGEQLIAPRRQA